jgi:hypothetical protein
MQLFILSPPTPPSGCRLPNTRLWSFWFQVNKFFLNIIFFFKQMVKANTLDSLFRKCNRVWRKRPFYLKFLPPKLAEGQTLVQFQFHFFAD